MTFQPALETPQFEKWELFLPQPVCRNHILSLVFIDYLVFRASDPNFKSTSFSW